LGEKKGSRLTEDVGKEEKLGDDLKKKRREGTSQQFERKRVLTNYLKVQKKSQDQRTSNRPGDQWRSSEGAEKM